MGFANPIVYQKNFGSEHDPPGAEFNLTRWLMS
jgi:hypothetical protein